MPEITGVLERHLRKNPEKSPKNVDNMSAGYNMRHTSKFEIILFKAAVIFITIFALGLAYAVWRGTARAELQRTASAALSAQSAALDCQAASTACLDLKAKAEDADQQWQSTRGSAVVQFLVH